MTEGVCKRCQTRRPTKRDPTEDHNGRHKELCGPCFVAVAQEVIDDFEAAIHQLKLEIEREQNG